MSGRKQDALSRWIWWLAAAMVCWAPLAHAQIDARDAIVRDYLADLEGLDSTEREVYEAPPIFAPPPTEAMTEPPADRSPSRPVTEEVVRTPERNEPELELFGSSFFSEPASSFEPVDQIPVPTDYRIGPGDNLIVNLWGRVDLTYHLTVDREGKVFLPEAGELVVWGQTLGEFRTNASALLERVYSDFEMNAMLGRVRSIQVFVLGEAEQTGVYTVSSLSTLVNVLHAAGGPSERGSLRRVRLMRNGSTVRTVDLYDLLAFGRGQPTLHLQSNDAIFVPVLGPTATVQGEVRRPAIYELVGGETIDDLLDLAGGLTAEAYRHRVQIERVVENGQRIVLEVDLAAATPAPAVLDGDVLHVRQVDAQVDGVVQLSGWVKYPGSFGLTRGMRVSDLLKEGDHLRRDSYLPRAVIRRRMPDGSHRLIPVNLNRILGYDDRHGSLAEDGALVASAGAPPGTRADDAPYYGAGGVGDPDPVLEPLDELRIYSVEDVGWKHFVTIDGEVNEPGRYPLGRGMRLSDLLFEARGLSSDAYQARAEVVRIHDDGENELLHVNLEQLLARGDRTVDLVLEDDDAVYVRSQPDRQRPERVIIAGEVRFPGKYSLEYPGEPLSEVLRRSGGPTGEAFIDGAVFERRSIIEAMNRNGVDNVFMSFVDSSRAVADEESRAADTGVEQRARVTIELDRLLSTGKPIYDVALRDGDRLFVPRRPSEVPVTGYVASNSAIHFEPQKNVGYYVDRAGGITPSGDKKGIRLVRADGQVVEAHRGMRVRLGDSIVVPPRVQSDGTTWRWVRDTSATLIGAAAMVLLLNQVK